MRAQAPQLHTLDRGAELLYVPQWLQPEEARSLWGGCLDLDWRSQPIQGVTTLRKNNWQCDDPAAVYRYSGQTWVPHRLTGELRALASRLAGELRSPFNAVLGTYYPDGKAGVSYHADDEALFAPDPSIASLSLRASRVFDVRHASRRDGKPDLRLPLDDGDLVVMRGSFQRYYNHRVAATARVVGPRINLSFRFVVGATPSSHP